MAVLECGRRNTLTVLVHGLLYFFQLCEKVSSIFVAIVGDLIAIVFFVFYGPLPGLNFPADISTNWDEVCVVLVLGILAVACGVVSSYARIQEASMKLGYVQNIDTYLLLSSMWSAIFFLANFTGSTIPGMLIEKFGIRMTTLMMIGFYFLGLFIDIYCYFKYERRSEKNTENTESDEYKELK